jgi:hypothetical protein
MIRVPSKIKASTSQIRYVHFHANHFAQLCSMEWQVCWWYVMTVVHCLCCFQSWVFRQSGCGQFCWWFKRAFCLHLQSRNMMSPGPCICFGASDSQRKVEGWCFVLFGKDHGKAVCAPKRRQQFPYPYGANNSNQNKNQGQCVDCEIWFGNYVEGIGSKVFQMNAWRNLKLHESFYFLVYNSV